MTHAGWFGAENQMKILLLAPFVPSETPRHGGEKLLFETLQHLSARHELALLAFSGPGGGPEDTDRMKAFCTVVRTVEKDIFHIPPTRRYINLFALKPSWFLHTASPDMTAALLQEVRSFRPDIVQVEFLGMAPYVHRIDHPAVVFNSHEAFGRSWKHRAAEPGPGLLGAYLLWDYLRLAREETRLLNRFRTVLAFSREDRDYFAARNRDASIHVWTPGVTVPFRLNTEGERPGGGVAKMLFLGSFRHPPNVEGIRFFCRRILPRILRRNPSVRLDVVGPDPPPSVRSLQGPGVTVHGYVEDLSGFYADRPVFVVPIRRGGGIRMKILEALGNGLPVVTTPEGAEGIEAVHREHWFRAGDPDMFAACASRLLSDAGLRDRVGRNARAWVREHHDWTRSVERLEAVYKGLV